MTKENCCEPKKPNVFDDAVNLLRKHKLEDLSLSLLVDDKGDDILCVITLDRSWAEDKEEEEEEECECKECEE